MNSKTTMMIVVIGGLGTIALVIAAMMGFGRLSTTPMVRVAVEVADKFQVREVNLALFPPIGRTRTLRVAYDTSVLRPSLDEQSAEMEGVAKFAFERIVHMELGTYLGEARAARGPITKVEVRRTWRNERGCLERSNVATHEWTPPPPPPGRR